EMLRLMKKAGCWQISFGIESGSQRILDFIKKGTKIPTIESALKMTRRAGIMTKGYFIIGHLTETKETIRETIDFAKRISLDDFQMSFMVPLPGTEAYTMACDYGAFNNNWSEMNIWTPVFIPKGLTQHDLESLSKQAFREFYFRPGPVANFLKRASRPAYFRKYFKDGLKIFKFLLKSR
ncbi:MAG: radical SAM protein, partial [Candidatus Omnitrophica bacterium]|nr:radical SAM protein [Candidatus Omnitrophota bacterium]